jgi:hypothetical protein
MGNAACLLCVSWAGFFRIRICIVFGKLDPDPHLNQNSRAFEAQNGAGRAVEAQNKGLQKLAAPFYVLKNNLPDPDTTKNYLV